MRFLLAIVPLLASIQAAFSASTPKGPYTPVSYTEAPSYYPGAPWQFGPKESRWNTCIVEAAGNGQDDAPAVIEAFQRCGKNGKVIFKDTTCTSLSALLIWSYLEVVLATTSRLLVNRGMRSPARNMIFR